MNCDFKWFEYFGLRELEIRNHSADATFSPFLPQMLSSPVNDMDLGNRILKMISQPKHPKF